MALELVRHTTHLTEWKALLASLRLSEFLVYPYLYVGTQAYEEEYAQAFLSSPRAMIIEAKVDGEFAGLVTAVPLAENRFLNTQGLEVLQTAGLKVEDLWYLSEVLVESRFRRQGVATALLRETCQAGLEAGFAKTCLMAVERPVDHISRPAGYRNPHALWEDLGFRPLKGRAWFTWPTRLPGGDVAEVPNPMGFWVRS